MDKRRVLIFGSGSILTREWVAGWGHAHEVTLVYSGKAPAGYGSHISLVPLSEGFAETLSPQTVVVVSAHITTQADDTDRLYEVNVALVQKIVSRYRRAKIVFCSTVSVYAPGPHTLTETSLLQPQNPYAVSKLWAEHLIQRQTVDYAILRISSLVGAGMKENTFIPRIIQDALGKNEIVLHGDGQRLQNYIDVSDLATLVEKAVASDARGLFLAVAPQSYTNAQVAETVRRHVPGTVIRYAGTDSAAGYVFNAHHTYGALAHTPSKKWDDSIRELIEWKKKR